MTEGPAMWTTEVDKEAAERPREREACPGVMMKGVRRAANTYISCYGNAGVTALQGMKSAFDRTCFWCVSGIERGVGYPDRIPPPSKFCAHR